MVVPGRTFGVEGQGVGNRRLRGKTRVVASVEPVEPQGVLVADERPGRARGSGGVKDGTVWVVISGGELFGRTIKAGSIRTELDDFG